MSKFKRQRQMRHSKKNKSPAAQGGDEVALHTPIAAAVLATVLTMSTVPEATSLGELPSETRDEIHGFWPGSGDRTEFTAWGLDGGAVDTDVERLAWVVKEYLDVSFENARRHAQALIGYTEILRGQKWRYEYVDTLVRATLEVAQFEPTVAVNAMREMREQTGLGTIDAQTELALLSSYTRINKHAIQRELDSDSLSDDEVHAAAREGVEKVRKLFRQGR